MKAFNLMVSIMLILATDSYAQDLAMTVNDGVLSEKSEVKAEPKAEAPKAEFVFPVYGEIPVAKVEFEEEHFLGDAIAKKWNTFLKNYTRVYDVEIGLTDSGSEIRKPAVFKAVERANRYVKKAWRNKTMDTDKAVTVMAHILDCANVICFDDNTEAFEKKAKEAKTGEEVIDLFNRVKLEMM